MAKHKARVTAPAQETAEAGASFAVFALILGCFFVSGLTGLTYQILWTRMIVKIIGSSPFAVSIVLTVFMGGLGLGSYLAGRTIDRVKEPARLVRLYGILELGIGAYAFVLPVLLAAFKPLYGLLYNRLFDSFLAYNFLTFVGCAVLLIVPVTFMGATLPILSRFFVTSLARVGTHVGRLYGLNTIGAAAGSLLCGFFLINALGVWGTVTLAVALNGLIGAACLVVSARLSRHALVSGQEKAEAKAEDRAAPKAHAERASFGTYALVIFAVSGFCAMAYEVIWIKLLGLIVGPTTYSFTIVLVTFITCLALGAMFFGWLGDRVRNTMALLLSTQAAAALSALAFSQVMGGSQIFFAKLIQEFKGDFGSLYLVKAAVLFGFMFLPTFCLGATFPLVGKIYTTSLARTGRSIGFAYAVNSVGAVLGSFCAGFVLIPLVGKETGLSLVVGLQLATALAVGVLAFRRMRMPVLRWAPLALVVCAGAALAFHYPQWDRKMLSKGKYHRLDASEMRSVGWIDALSPGSLRFAEDEGEELVYYGDGIGGFTAVMKRDVIGDTHTILLNSGKPDASFPGDMATQTLLAHFPLLFHPRPQNVLIIGLASGITAGEALHYPVERLDVVDINEKVVEASDFFREWNGGVLSDPRTRLIIQDGRAHLAMTDQMYDVISSEPSNPWMAGLASLFTREFYELGRAHLNSGGMFVQWAHAYAMDWPAFAMVGRTFADVFPNSIMVNTDPTQSGGDYLLVGMKGEGKLDAGIAAKNLAHARKSKNVVLADHRVLYNLIVSENLKGLFGDGPVHTENRPYLEYAAPKLLHVDDPTIRERISENARLGEATERIVRGNAADLDARIDFAAYALSVFRPAFAFANHVDLAEASPEQTQRFSDLVAGYCGENIERGVFLLEDDEIRERCVSVQLETVEKRMVDARDPVPYLKRLGEMYSSAGLFDRATEHFSKALLSKPDDPETHVNLGILLTREKRYDEAVGHFTKAIDLAPESPRAYNNLGATLAEQGKAAEALGYFSEALRKDAGFAEAHFNMANALASQGRLDEAARHFADAIRLRPDFTEAHINLGNALLAQGKLEDAIARYSAAVRVQPDNAFARYGLGAALARQGRTGEAIDHLSRAVEVKPDYAQALSVLAWMLATDPNARYRDGARAVRLAERAIDATADEHPLLLDTLAAAHAESGDFDKARRTAAKAVALARSTGRAEWAQEMEKRLELYNQGRAYRAEPR